MKPVCLVIGAVWPEPRSSAAGSRMLQLLSPLMREGWAVTYASTGSDSEHAMDLLSLGIESVSVKVNDAGFDDRLRSLMPDVVLFDRFYIEEQFGWRVEEHCPDALRILDGEDLHCLRDARERAHHQGREVHFSDLMGEVGRREIAAILRSDLTLIISTHEMGLLVEQFRLDPALLHYCPFMIEPPTALQRGALPAFEDRCDFSSIGNFRHPPNWDAVQWLKNDVWPLIRKRLPHANLHIAGAYASREHMALHEPGQGFFMDGRVGDVDDFLRTARICLAPLRFGAGLKGKLIDAMRNGTPSITTSIGAEGMCRSEPWGGCIAEDAASIAQAAVGLYEDKSAWESAQASGFEILESRFDRSQHESILVDQIEQARVCLAQRRLANFTGAMLRDHHHRSTRYLSLWIEAKSRLAAQQPGE
jgi:hypothetical protein